MHNTSRSGAAKRGNECHHSQAAEVEHAPAASCVELPAPLPQRGRGTGRRVARGQVSARPPRDRKNGHRVTATPPQAPPPRGHRPRHRRMAAGAKSVAAASPDPNATCSEEEHGEHHGHRLDGGQTNEETVAAGALGEGQAAVEHAGVAPVAEIPRINL